MENSYTKPWLKLLYAERVPHYEKEYYTISLQNTEAFLIVEYFHQHTAYGNLYTFEIKLPSDYRFRRKPLEKLLRKLGYRLLDVPRGESFFTLSENNILLFATTDFEETGVILQVIDNLDKVIESATPFSHHESE